MAQNLSPVFGVQYTSCIPPVAARNWNARELSLDSSYSQSTHLQEWSDDVLDPEALVEGIVHDEVTPTSGNALDGKARLWEAADQTPSRAAPAKLFLPELSSWLPYEESNGAVTSSPPPEDMHGPGDAFDDCPSKTGDAIAGLDLRTFPKTPVDAAPSKSFKTHLSDSTLQSPGDYSPASLAEDVVSFLETKSPSPTSHFLDRGNDQLTQEDKDTPADLGRPLELGKPQVELTRDTVVSRPRGAIDGPYSKARTTAEICGGDFFSDSEDYINSQHAFLRRQELEVTFCSDYVDKPNRPGVVSAVGRATLLDWLKRLHLAAPTVRGNTAKLSPETLFLAAKTLDRFLSTPNARRKLFEGGWNLKFAAASALSLASKYEDVESPSLWAIALASKLASEGGSTSAGVSGDSCRWISGEARAARSPCKCDVCGVRRELCRVEELMMSALGFRMMAPTVMSFVGIYLVRAERLGYVQSPEVARKLRDEVTETLWSVVRDASSLCCHPSQLAAAAFHLAYPETSFGQRLWSDLAVTGIELGQLQECLGNVQRAKEEEAPSRRRQREVEGHYQGCPAREGAVPGGHADGDFERPDRAGVSPGVLDAGRLCDSFGNALAFGLGASGFEVASGVADSFLRLAGVNTNDELKGGVSWDGSLDILSMVGLGCGFLESVLRLGGVEIESESRDDCSQGGDPGVALLGGGGTVADSAGSLGDVKAGGGQAQGVDVFMENALDMFEVGVGGFVESILRLGGVETDGFLGYKGLMGDVEVFDVGGCFAESVLRLGGVESSHELGDDACWGDMEVSVVEVAGGFADSVLRLGGVVT